MLLVFGVISMVTGQRPVVVSGRSFSSEYPGNRTQSREMGKQVEEPSTKRSKPISKVTSLVNLLPPVKSTPLKRIGQTLQRSITFRNENRTERAMPPPPPPRPPTSSIMKARVMSVTLPNPSSNMTASRVSIATGPASKRRDSKLWSETFDVRLGATQSLSPKEIKRQEAIFELAQGEQDLVEDLRLAKKAYHDPMLKLSIMTEQELNQIFGTLESLIPLHEDLLSQLRDARKPDGSTEHVGHILADWLPCLSSYTSYCSNQVKAKALLDQKKQDRRVQDFLQRCLQSPFSRKLDLWNFLDIPRSRLVKYPLLLREILKHTPNDHPDQQHLEEAMLMVQNVVADINRQTGESECQYYKDRLLYSEEGQRDELIDRTRTLSCHGELKNNRGLKLHVFLFQDVLVITRLVSLNNQPVSYQLCRQPIPIRQLDLEDLPDGEMRVGGSIRGAFSNNERTKNFFRVSYRAGGQLQTLCFQASDTFNKQQWINCIRQAKEAAELTGDQHVDAGLRGQIGTCFETSLSACKDSGLEMEAGLSLEEQASLNGGEDFGLFKEDKETEEGKTGAEVEDGLFGDSGKRLALDRILVMDSETMPTAVWKMDEGGETLISGDDNFPSSVSSSPFPTQEEGAFVEEEEQEEEENGSKEEEQVSMDTGECAELTYRC
ncbi:rho guanine nucleotide exchange factor 3 isoform X3 [Nothobranchius furzeri]|uniref:rho guanine nucleotide exchange factor 3 isoform X3 n=1 Tax=Nothobranchius furzeri TaxID=105023 RepID=UPI0039048572